MDKYEQFEAIYDPAWQDPLRPHRQPKQESQRKRQQIISGLTDDLKDVELGLTTTYRPSRYEQGWLLSSLYTFFDEGLITDVLAQIKGGKEASVYCCRANPATGADLLAAKVYRPRMFRNLRNDKMYRQGREILVAGGAPAGRDAGYIQRAIRSKSAFGLQSAHTSWLMHEFTALERLYDAGAAVPRPIAPSDNAILMSYLGDEQLAAPTLNTVRLGVDEAESLFQELLRNVDIMLQHELVHGDLSAYNILYWAPGDAWGEMTLIDFPQVINLHTNRKARFILKRDLTRACEYFCQQGVDCNPNAVFNELWKRHVDEPDPEDVAADWSRLEHHLDSLAEEEGSIER
jgi:RIO kinase 1